MRPLRHQHRVALSVELRQPEDHRPMTPDRPEAGPPRPDRGRYRATISFYESVLGMRATRSFPPTGPPAGRWPSARRRSICTGRAMNSSRRPRDPVPGSADLCFLTDAPIEDWQAHWRPARRSGRPGAAQRRAGADHVALSAGPGRHSDRDFQSGLKARIGIELVTRRTGRSHPSAVQTRISLGACAGLPCAIRP